MIKPSGRYTRNEKRFLKKGNNNSYSVPSLHFKTGTASNKKRSSADQDEIEKKMKQMKPLPLEKQVATILEGKTTKTNTINKIKLLIQI